jgi:hypothetical protein
VRDPGESKNRLQGDRVVAGSVISSSSSEVGVGGAAAAAAGASAAGLSSSRVTSFEWEVPDEAEDEEAGGMGESRVGSGGGGEGGLGLGQRGGAAPTYYELQEGTGAPRAQVDTWFSGKVDTGPVAQRAERASHQMRAPEVAVLDRPSSMPQVRCMACCGFTRAHAVAPAALTLLPACWPAPTPIVQLHCAHAASPPLPRPLTQFLEFNTAMEEAPAAAAASTVPEVAALSELALRFESEEAAEPANGEEVQADAPSGEARPREQQGCLIQKATP